MLHTEDRFVSIASCISISLHVCSFCVEKEFCEISGDRVKILSSSILGLVKASVLTQKHPWLLADFIRKVLPGIDPIGYIIRWCI